MPVAITALYAGLLGLLVVALGFNVTVHRWILRVPLGDGGNPLLVRVIRMHGNTVESVPIAVLLMALYELDGGLRTALHAAGMTLIVGRLLYAGTLWADGGWNLIRATGVTLTWLTISALAVLNIWQIG